MSPTLKAANKSLAGRRNLDLKSNNSKHIKQEYNNSKYIKQECNNSNRKNWF